MATLTRVPLVFSSSKVPAPSSKSLGYCYKCNCVASSLPLTRKAPDCSTLSFHSFSSSSSSFSSLTTKDNKGFRRKAAVLASMADLSTVLVTGAGGRTGLVLFCFVLFSVFLLFYLLKRFLFVNFQFCFVLLKKMTLLWR